MRDIKIIYKDAYSIEADEDKDQGEGCLGMTVLASLSGIIFSGLSILNGVDITLTTFRQPQTFT